MDKFDRYYIRTFFPKYRDKLAHYIGMGTIFAPHAHEQGKVIIVGVIYVFISVK